jgi:Asp-tRNA(Asn)/Glu-tRNA(Gln) amidotransferase A subunit family amidase
MGAVDFKRIEFVRTRAWKQLAAILRAFDALLCPTMSQVARPVDEDDFVWYRDDRRTASTTGST